MIEITEDTMCELYENIEKCLKYMGKAMQHIEEVKSESYERKGRRHEEEDDYDDMERYGERGGVRSGMRGRGRYGKY